MKRKPIQVLYIEDDPADVELVKVALDQTCVEVEYQLIVGDHGDHAIDLLAKPDFDIILLDYNIPRKSGLEILQHIRHNLNLKNLPVILLTGSDSQAVIDRAKILGISACFKKPLSYSGFKDVFRKICHEWFIPLAEEKIS